MNATVRFRSQWIKKAWLLLGLGLMLGSCAPPQVDHGTELSALVYNLAAARANTPAPGFEPPRFVAVPGGTYAMGSRGGDADEAPVHEVTVRALWVSATEVTQAQYAGLRGTNPSQFTALDHPVDNVSWLDAVAYCNALSLRLGLEAAYTVKGDSVSFDSESNGIRLPTEAEWEWLARGGSGRTVAGWTSDSAGGTSHKAGALAANALGLYDLTGNVWEWCWDWYAPYAAGAQTDPQGPETGTYRVGRGGTWALGPYAARATNRVELGTPGYHNAVAGFRVVRNRGTS